jgi:hypothetical protein
MTEPCRHERAVSDALAELAGVSAEHEQLHADLFEAHATIGRLDEDIAGWISRAVEAEATIERVRALLGDTAGPLWSVRGVREADIRAALETL